MSGRLVTLPLLSVDTMLCGKPAEWPWSGDPRPDVAGRLPCNRELGHPGTCSAKARPTDPGGPELKLRPRSPA